MCLPALWKFPDINKIRANVALGSIATIRHVLKPPCTTGVIVSEWVAGLGWNMHLQNNMLFVLFS